MHYVSAIENNEKSPNQDTLSQFGLSGSGHGQQSPLQLDFDIILTGWAVVVKGSF